jgi:arsenate reductase-like glutaredoxin family protein
MKLRLSIVFFTIFLLASCNEDNQDTDKKTASTPQSQTNKQTGTQLESNKNPTSELELEEIIKKSGDEFVPVITADEENPEEISEEELETSSEKIEEEFIEESPEMVEESDPESSFEENIEEKEFVNPEE